LKHITIFIMSLIIIGISESQVQNVNFNIGIKAGLNFTKSDYIGEGKYFYIDHLQKSTPTLAWDLLCVLRATE